MADKIKVLMLAANRDGFVYVRLTDEARDIDNKVQLGSYRGSFQLIPETAVKISDLGILLLRHEPHVLHFSGHGKPSEGIVFQDESGLPVPLSAEQLERILRNLKSNIRLVFLNVCHSKDYAEVISHAVDFVVGMDGDVKDKEARAFAASFYQTLAFGRSVSEAFEMAKEHLRMRGLAGDDVPVLMVREGADSSKPFIGGREDADRSARIVMRLIDGTASEDDRRMVQDGVMAGKIIFDEIENDPAGESDRQVTSDVLLDDNQLHVRLGPAGYKRVKQQLFPAPPGIAPPLPPFIFIGREGALEDIKRHLGNAGGSAGRNNTTVVRGWPGVGKTTLVGVIGHDRDIANMFPQGVLWTSLEQNPNVLSEMARWGGELGADDILRAPTVNEATASLAAALRHRRMLLIVDDVWDTAHAVPFTRVVGEQCALLITTRLPKVAEALVTDDNKIYVLPVLTEEDALNLLRILAPSVVEQHQDECRALVRDLECLPLALHVAGRLLKSESKLGWGVTDLIDEIREGAKLLPAPAPNDRIEGGMIPTVSALLMKSTNTLDEFTRECFAYLGVFAPKPATFDLSAMKAVWLVDDPKPIVRKLVEHGLLEPVGSGRFQMHRILVDHAAALCAG
jgi:hypothetical protein